MAKKERKLLQVTWRFTPGDKLNIFIRIMRALELIHPGLKIPHSGEIEDIGKRIVKRFESDQSAHKKGGKGPKVVVKFSHSTAYITFDYWGPNGHLRYVFNRFVKDTAKNKHFAEFTPGRSFTTLRALAPLILIIGQPTLVTEEWSGDALAKRIEQGE